jgi:hypothetical protein
VLRPRPRPLVIFDRLALDDSGVLYDNPADTTGRPHQTMGARGSSPLAAAHRATNGTKNKLWRETYFPRLRWVQHCISVDCR